MKPTIKLKILRAIVLAAIITMATTLFDSAAPAIITVIAYIIGRADGLLTAGIHTINLMNQETNTIKENDNG